MAHEVRVAVDASQLEVPVLGCQPRVEYFGDGDPTVTKNQGAWRLLAAMARVALHVDTEQALFCHPFIIGPVMLRGAPGHHYFHEGVVRE